MIDLVYILGTGSQWGDNELRYSLRSACKHLRNWRNIHIVGSRPQFWEEGQEVSCGWIPAEDLRPRWARAHNLRDKLLLAAVSPEISDEFLLMNDDFFFLRDADATEWPYYRQGTLGQYLEWRENDKNCYLECMAATKKHLEARLLKTGNYEVHVPIRYQKSELKKVLLDFPWTEHPAGLLDRSLYGNVCDVKWEPLEDCKIYDPLPASEILRRLCDQPCFSIGDGALDDGSDMKKLLQYLFPV